MYCAPGLRFMKGAHSEVSLPNGTQSASIMKALLLGLLLVLPAQRRAVGIVVPIREVRPELFQVGFCTQTGAGCRCPQVLVFVRVDTPGGHTVGPLANELIARIDCIVGITIRAVDAGCLVGWYPGRWIDAGMHEQSADRDGIVAQCHSYAARR